MATVAEAAWDRRDAKVRAEAFEQGVAQGIESGFRQGGARLITRQAALKFGGGTAERLRGLLEGLRRKSGAKTLSSPFIALTAQPEHRPPARRLIR